MTQPSYGLAYVALPPAMTAASISVASIAEDIRHGRVGFQQIQESNVNARVILLTGSDDEAVFDSARKFDYCSVVQKQAGVQVLISSIRLLHEQASHICPTPA